MENSVAPAKKEAPTLASLKKMFEESVNLTATAREQSRIDDDYYHGYQWTTEERNTLKGRQQPDLVFNRIRPAINGTLGVLHQGETDPRAYPRNPGDEDSADVASKTLRFVADKNNFDAMKLDGAQSYLVQGTCAAIVEVDEDRQVTIEPVRWEEFFYDPRARRQDFKDARYLGCAKWMYADDVAALYPKSKDELNNCVEGAGGVLDDTFDDRPSDGGTSVAWVDKKKRRLMVVEIYHREGREWNRCVYHGGGLLDYGVSAYLDDKKRPTCPIEAQSCFVDRENNRYGVVRDMRGPQDEINKRRSKLLHLINVSQIQAVDPSAQEVDADTARKEAARPDGVIPFGWQKVPTTDVATGQANLLAEAKAEIERMGPNPAILGRQGENQSGRANLVRQQAGLTEQAIIFGGIEDWELRIYRQVWARVRQYWTAPQFVRVTDDEGSPQFVGINQPKKGLDPMTGQEVVLGYENVVAELDVDIMLDSVPDTANVQQEQFQMLADLAKVYPQDVTFDDLLEASSMPNKRQIIEKRKARQEQNAQQNGGAQQLQQRGAMAEIAKTEAEVVLTQAKAETEQAKPHIEAAKLRQAEDHHIADTHFRGAEMAQGDQRFRTETAIRGAEMQQADNQFSGKLSQQEQLARMQAASKAQSPPPGQ